MSPSCNCRGGPNCCMGRYFSTTDGGYHSTSSPDMSRVAGACPYCSSQWTAAIHPVGSAGCRVRVIEYHPDGTVKRVEFQGLDTATQTRSTLDWKVTVDGQEIT